MNQLSKMLRATGVLLALLLAAPAFAAAPKTMLLEGYVHTAAGPAPDGKYTLTFSLYGAQNAATSFWQEAGVAVDVAGGHFSYALGTSKPLDPALLANATEVWVGLKVDNDPELPRSMMHAVGFALRAAVADLAIGLGCTGCVKASSMNWDADIDLAGQSLKATQVTAKTVNSATVIAQEFVGDGSKLTGIKLPNGSCPSGQAVTGINADGTLACKKLTADTPTGSLEAVSGGTITNEFSNVESAPTKNVSIPDNTGLDALSTITFPDVGVAKTLSITIDIESSDLSQVAITILPPDDKKVGYTVCDPCGKAGEKILKATLPVPMALKTGSLEQWVGQNPKGLWNLKVKDTGYCIPQLPGNSTICDVNKATDGWIHDWSINVVTVSASDIAVKGQLVAWGGIRVGATGAPCTDKNVGALRYTTELGLQLCDGKAWAPVAAKNGIIHYSGTCTSTASSSTYSFCLNKELSNTAQDYLTVTTTGYGANDFNTGRVLIKKPGYYRFSFNRRGRGSSCQWWMYKSGTQFAYGYQTKYSSSYYINDSGSRIMPMKANDYFNLKFYCNSTAWYANDTTLDVEYLGE
ncbi:MAG: hypothetical protein RIT45_2877 [Pseudomonadota bacterium]|jgi:hypothetical protein